MASSHCTISDLILLFAVVCFTSDVGPRWKTYQSCRRPLPMWLVVSFVSVALSRLAYFTGQCMTSEPDSYRYDDEMGELLLLSDPRGPPKWLSIISIGVLFPFFLVWTVIGSFWFAEVVDDQAVAYCFSDKSQVWLYLFWLVVCYFWAALYSIYIVIVLVDSDEGVSEGLYGDPENTMWPDAGLFVGHGCPFWARGLPASKIRQLPYVTIKTDAKAERLTREVGNCAICLETFYKGDDVRKLKPCKHIFHRGCIDLWMLRSGSCPNCKGLVGSPAAIESPETSVTSIISRIPSEGSLTYPEEESAYQEDWAENCFFLSQVIEDSNKSTSSGGFSSKKNTNDSSSKRCQSPSSSSSSSPSFRNL